MAGLCTELFDDLAPLKSELKLLDEFYVPTRYPDAIPGGMAAGLPVASDAMTTLETAASVLALVQRRLP